MGTKEKAANKYINKTNHNKQGYLMTVIQYNAYDSILVEFSEPYRCVVSTRVDHFLKGDVVNPYAPCVCGIGIVGNKYPTHSNDGKHYLREYLMWTNMIKRCYDETARNKNRTYIDCECCEDWIYYENFYDWLHSQENYIILDSINDISIDKDILFKGNKMYSPKTCCLVPKYINNLLIKSDAIRGECCIGVSINKRDGKYKAQCGGKKNHAYLGLYDTEEEAFNAYKKHKETQIRKSADEAYRQSYITKECYEALINYNVEITD
jgi:hypothetical protein